MQEKARPRIRVVRMDHIDSMPQTSTRQTPPQPVRSAQAAHLQCFSTEQPVTHPALCQSPEEIELVCDDGHRAQLGAVNALLCGCAPARETILSYIMENQLAHGRNVLLLTGRGMRSETVQVLEEAAHSWEQPVRYISGRTKTSGFAPLAGWSQEQIEYFFCQKLAAEYLGSHACRPSNRVRTNFRQLLDLVRQCPDAAEKLYRGAEVQDLLDCCEQLPDTFQTEEMARAFRNGGEDCALAARLIGDFLRAFQPLCTAADHGSERYSLFSPGAVVLGLDDNAVNMPGTIPWYLCRMVETVDELPCAKVTVILDAIGSGALAAFSDVLLNAQVRVIAVCDLLRALGDETEQARFRGRFRQQFIFTQQDEGAEYWSKLSGERELLKKEYSQSRGSSFSLFQFGINRQESVTYRREYRPVLELNHFTQLADNEGELWETGSRTNHAFHHFSVELR